MTHLRSSPEEHPVVKDAEYFNDLRKAVSWTSPTAIFGTSGLAMYRRIESAQDFELHKQLPREIYSRYHFLFWSLRILTAIIPWLSLLPPAAFLSSALPLEGISETHLYELVVATLALGITAFIIAKVIQFLVWRAGSAAIRYMNGISRNSRIGDPTSESDLSN